MFKLLLSDGASRGIMKKPTRSPMGRRTMYATAQRTFCLRPTSLVGLAAVASSISDSAEPPPSPSPRV